MKIFSPVFWVSALASASVVNGFCWSGYGWSCSADDVRSLLAVSTTTPTPSTTKNPSSISDARSSFAQLESSFCKNNNTFIKKMECLELSEHEASTDILENPETCTSGNNLCIQNVTTVGSFSDCTLPAMLWEVKITGATFDGQNCDDPNYPEHTNKAEFHCHVNNASSIPASVAQCENSRS